MEFVRRATATGASAAIFPGAWNPPTRAHLALAHAALAVAAEVVFVLPRSFPHKPLDGPGPERRLAWLQALAETEPAFSVAVSEGGLFLDMAREYRAHHPSARILLLCGSDAAHRIVTWPYEREPTIERQLEEYELLVAPRPGLYLPPPHIADKVHAVDLAGDYRLVSSTDARLAIESGLDARSLVPDQIWEDVSLSYPR